MKIGQQNLAFGADLRVSRNLENHLKSHFSETADSFKKIQAQFQDETKGISGTLIVKGMDFDRITRVGYIKPGENIAHVQKPILENRKPSIFDDNTVVVDRLKVSLASLVDDSKIKTKEKNTWDSVFI